MLTIARFFKELLSCAKGDLDAGQYKQLQNWQTEQQAGKNHKNNAHRLETKALSNSGNQKHGGQKNRDAYVLISSLSGFCSFVGYLRSLFAQTKELLVLRVVVVGHENRAGRRLCVIERVRL